jgi:hypothetical protein
MLSNNPEAALAEPPARYAKDEKLWGLLPSKDAPYSYDQLSKAETDALVEALGDGFGSPLDPRRQPSPLPSKVRSGLLGHQFYCRPGSDYDQENDHAFWSSANGDDALSPCEEFPLGFCARRLRIYFQNQFERFCKQLARDDPALKKREKWVLEELAMRRLYEKAWYEAHALLLLNWTEDRTAPKDLALWCNAVWTGQLGRLVEQYYWRFRFEDVAAIGIRARKGASAGGLAKADSHRSEHSAWQSLASEIWARRPELGNTSVGELIRKRLGLKLSAKHIGRYIIHPKKNGAGAPQVRPTR